MTVLQPGDPFPSVTVFLPGGRTLRLPDALAGRFGVVLYYRGSWCPYCNAQLSAFQRSLDSLADADISVVALSVDDEATTVDLIAGHGLRFPVGHSASAAAIAHSDRRIRQPRPAIPAVHRFRARPRRPGHRQRVLQRRHRPARPAGRHRPGRLPPRTRPGQLTPLARRESPAHDSGEHVHAAHLTQSHSPAVRVRRRIRRTRREPGGGAPNRMICAQITTRSGGRRG